MADGHGAGGAGVVLCSISRAVVDDDDEVHSRDGAAGPDSGGDALSLILGRDDHGNALVGPLGGTHSPRVSRLPASSRYLSTSLSRAFFVRPVKFCDLVPCGAESSGSTRSAGTPADPRARRADRCDTPMHHEEGTPRHFQTFLGDLVSNLQHGTTVPGETEKSCSNESGSLVRERESRVSACHTRFSWHSGDKEPVNGAGFRRRISRPSVCRGDSPAAPARLGPHRPHTLCAGQCKALASRSSPTLPRSMPRLWKARRSSSPPSVRACAWALRRPACQTRSPTA